MYKNNKIAAVIPAYNEEKNIATVINSIPQFVDYVIVINDKSTDGTAEIIKLLHDGTRVFALHNSTNLGVGGTRVAGFTHVLTQTDADIIVNIDGDGQMDLTYLPTLLDPIINGYDFSKGNRFYTTTSFTGMPSYRIAGNIMLTFLNKISTGYWSVFDPQNGYTAIKTTTLKKIDLTRLSLGYSFENDFIGNLSLINATIKDVDIPAIYGNETSSINLKTVIPEIITTLTKILIKRFWYKYILRSFSPIAIFVIVGIPLLLFSLIFGTYIVLNAIGPNEVSAANAALTSLTFSTGFMTLLAALVLDILNEPKKIT